MDRFVTLSFAISLIVSCNVSGGGGGGGFSSGGVNTLTCEGSVLSSSFFRSNLVSATTESCTLSNGSMTTCCRLTFGSNPLEDEGPFCPSTTAETGGFGIYDGTTNPGFQEMNNTLFTSMEADGYDILDGSNVRIQDPGNPGMVNPSFAYCLQATPDDALTLSFLIPMQPEDLPTTDTIEPDELIGVSLDGIPINGHPPSVTNDPTGTRNIQALDRCGGHHDPAGYYHWHFIPESVNAVLTILGGFVFSCEDVAQDSSALTGFAKDGYPIYADRDGVITPTDLDACNGHSGTTEEFPDGVYHYHASAAEAPNVPPCVTGASVSEVFTVE